jgi:hypothetical protein
MHKEKSVYIVGGGPSLKGFNFNCLKDKDVIAVNKAIRDVPWAKYFISIDSTFFDKVEPSFLEKLPPDTQTIFVANLAPSYMIKDEDGRVVDTRSNRVYKLDCFDRVITSHTATGIGLTEDDFRTGGVTDELGSNSGFCALQLAVIEGYTHIVLLGIDLCNLGGETHYHEGYGVSQKRFEPRLPMYAQGFVNALGILKELRPDIVVENCSKSSALVSVLGVTDIKKTFKERNESHSL